MYFKDLSKYTYSKGDADAVNVGWLDSSKHYPKGEVTDEFLQALMKHYKYPVFVTRGFHQCNLCPVHEQSPGVPVIEYGHIKRETGFYEIRVLGENGVTYAAPSMIFHYITHHKYLPPEEFIGAVLSFDEQVYKEKFYKNPLYVRDRFWLEQDRTIL